MADVVRATLTQLKKFKAQKSAGKIMATVFWDAQSVILVVFLPKGETINSEAYIQTQIEERGGAKLEWSVQQQKVKHH